VVASSAILQVDASALIVAIGNQKRRRPQFLEKSKSLLFMLAITFV
jgi:hypothetical protein